jgi:hypothetical protein
MGCSFERTTFASVMKQELMLTRSPSAVKKDDAVSPDPIDVEL